MTDVDDGDGLMTPIRPDQLEPGAVIAQSLDNQWVPDDLTVDMIEQGKVPGPGRRPARQGGARPRVLPQSHQREPGRDQPRLLLQQPRDQPRPDGGGRGPHGAPPNLLRLRAPSPFLLNERHPAQGATRPPACGAGVHRVAGDPGGACRPPTGCAVSAWPGVTRTTTGRTRRTPGSGCSSRSPEGAGADRQEHRRPRRSGGCGPRERRRVRAAAR
ncbi:hypothetical protein LV779_16230 [Streptomyces thinghirensis]|nr:hypothetical protein [Streptomyces thinghirensis]